MPRRPVKAIEIEPTTYHDVPPFPDPPNDLLAQVSFDRKIALFYGWHVTPDRLTHLARIPGFQFAASASVKSVADVVANVCRSLDTNLDLTTRRDTRGVYVHLAQCYPYKERPGTWARFGFRTFEVDVGKVGRFREMLGLSDPRWFVYHAP